MHETRGHRDQRAIGENEILLGAEFLDAGENVIPSTAVQSCRMFAQLVKNLVHLERCRDGFDQHRRADCPARNSELILREIEHAVPNPRFEMALHLREIEVRTTRALEQLTRVVKEMQSEVEESARNRFAVDQHMFLR